MISLCYKLDKHDTIFLYKCKHILYYTTILQYKQYM